jgi:hypothetical protein
VHDFHHATLGILEGMGFAVFFTQYLKLYTGKYRPNYDNSDASDGRQAFPYVCEQHISPDHPLKCS